MSEQFRYQVKVFTDKAGKNLNGEVWFENRYMVLDSGGTLKYFNIETLSIENGGAGGRILFFKPAEEPGFVFFTSDYSILKSSELKNITDQSKHLRKVIRKNRSGRHSLLRVAVGFSIFIVILVVTFILVKPLIIDAIPVSAEEDLGEFVFNQMDLDILYEEDVQVAFIEMLKPLIDTVEDSGYDFTFHIVNDSDVNAFALPGGIIVVNTGLLKEADKASEVCGVVAHEIAHVTCRHSLKQMVDQYGLTLLIRLTMNNIGEAAELVGETGIFLASRKFSRNHEREADATGVSLMLKAGLNPYGFSDFFTKLKLEIEESSQLDISSLPGFTVISTHPGFEERISNVNEIIEASGFDGNKEEHFNIEKIQSLLF